MGEFLGLGNLMQGVGHAGAAGNLLSEAFSAAGGLPGIISKFQQAGLGDKVQSWVGSGSNLPISAEEVTRVFPPQQIESWAEAHGVPSGVASQILAHLLPDAVDSHTPEGDASQNVGGAGYGGATPGAAEAAAPQGAGEGFDFGGLVQRLLGR